MRFFWVLLLPIVVAVWYGALGGRGRVNGPLLYVAAFGTVGAIVASVFGSVSWKRSYGTFEMDAASARVEGRVIADRRDVRQVFRPPRAERGWIVHRRWYQPPLRLDFEEREDDERLGQELGEYLGTPPAWGASPFRVHIWIAILGTLLAVALPFLTTALVGKPSMWTLLEIALLAGIVFCPTRLSLQRGELREAWLWGVRRVALDDIERYDFVKMDHQKTPSFALRLHLRGGRTRRFGIGIAPEDHRVVDALRREFELRQTRIRLGTPAPEPVATDAPDADVEDRALGRGRATSTDS
ncbi:MAG: hypothetical protein U0414_17055 [Polyangiaceae bacterium]